MLTAKQQENILATVPILRANGVDLTKYFYNRMFTNHPELKNIFNAGNQKNGAQPTALALSVLAYAENIANPGVLGNAVTHIGHKHASLNITADQYSIVGDNLLNSIKEVLGEEVATPDIIDAWAAAYEQLANLMIGVEQKMYNHKMSKLGGWLGWRKFTVKSKVKESEEVTSFYLYPEDGKVVSKHMAGQYVSVNVFVKALDRFQARQYSISSAPNNEYYRISVKRELVDLDSLDKKCSCASESKCKEARENKVYAGMVSNLLHDEIEEGNTIELSSPSGGFGLSPNAQYPKVFINGGIGITPLVSMLQVLLKQEQVPQINWIQGFRSPSVQAFKNDLEEWTNKHPQLKSYTFYEEDCAKAENVIEGRVDLDKIEGLSFNNQTDYFICGPQAFIQANYDYLVSKGVSAKQIFFEEFGPHTLGILSPEREDTLVEA